MIWIWLPRQVVSFFELSWTTSSTFSSWMLLTYYILRQLKIFNCWNFLRTHSSVQISSTEFYILVTPLALSCTTNPILSSLRDSITSFGDLMLFFCSSLGWAWCFCKTSVVLLICSTLTFFLHCNSWLVSKTIAIHIFRLFDAVQLFLCVLTFLPRWTCSHKNNGTTSCN